MITSCIEVKIPIIILTSVLGYHIYNTGIVNVVTKDGGQNYDGNLDFYAGGYHSNHSDIYSLSSPFSNWQSFTDLNGDGN